MFKKWGLIFSLVAWFCSLPIADRTSSKAFAQVRQVGADWARDCPPNGYRVAQPPFDFDLVMAGTRDSWDVPITLPNPAGGTYATTDAMNNVVLLPCIPDPAGPGMGTDHYSPRFRANGGARQGDELGRCLYECGSNSWELSFTATGGVPDRFKKSKWETRDGDPNHPAPVCRRKPKEITTYITDLTQKKIAPVKTKETPGATGGYKIVDATIADLETPLSDIILDGQPIGYPEASSDGSTMGVHNDSRPSCTNILQEIDRPIYPGEYIAVTGVITNTDSVSHNYSLSLFFVNAVFLRLLVKFPVSLAPGDSLPYYIIAGVPLQVAGPIGVFSLAFSDAEDRFDGSLDAIILQAQRTR